MNSTMAQVMALFHYPKVGEVLLCDFRGYEPPEMIKTRPVVVVAGGLNGRSTDLVTIIPLSGQANQPPMLYQIPITLSRPLSQKFDKLHVWAKCDMVAVVSRKRLDRFKIHKVDGGTPQWLSGQISGEQVQAIRVGIVHGLSLSLDKLG